MRIKGTIKNWINARGFGFVVPDDGGDAMFTHISDVATELEALPKGARVEFEVGTSRNGKPAAKNVLLVSP